MSSKSEAELDGSPEMRDYFREVASILRRKGKSDEEAQALIERYFFIGVDPLERVLVMHRSPEDVAADFLAANEHGRSAMAF